MSYTNESFVKFIHETAELAATDKAKNIAQGLNGYVNSQQLVNGIEFWNWMEQNYHTSGIFSSAESIKSYINSSPGKAEWLQRQLQGKGFEWDWVTRENAKIGNLFKKFDLGTDSTQAGFDVILKNMLTGSKEYFQHKSSLPPGRANLNLKNCPEDAIVVTQKDNINSVKLQNKGKVGFQSKKQSQKSLDDRFKKARSGKVSLSPTLTEVAKVAGKAAMMGAVIGAGIEAYTSWEAYNSNKITGKEYSKEIVKSAAHAGIVGGGTAAIAVYVNTAIASATGGTSIFVTIPVTIIIASSLDYLVAPMFGKGKYLEHLNDMRLYKSVGDAYVDLIIASQESTRHFCLYSNTFDQLSKEMSQLDSIESDVNIELLKAQKRMNNL